MLFVGCQIKKGINPSAALFHRYHPVAKEGITSAQADIETAEEGCLSSDGCNREIHADERIEAHRAASTSIF